MAKIAYTNLKLKIKEDVKSFDFNGTNVEVLQYLPIEDKYSLINITLDEAKEGSIYNPIKLDMYFHLNLVYMYTNISFTDKQKEDENKLYNTLFSNGIIDQVIENMDDNEYNTLIEYIENTMEDKLKFDNSVAGIIRNIIDTLPQKTEEMQEIFNSFDTEKFQEVMNLAKATGGKIL